MKSSGQWGSDLELFAKAILFSTDIWVYPKYLEILGRFLPIKYLLKSSLVNLYSP